MMINQFASASGYLTIFAPYMLLIVGQCTGLPLLGFVVIMGVGPLLRMATGNLPEDPPEWDERVSTFLDRLPLAFGLMFPLLVAGLLIAVSMEGIGMGWGAVALGLSLWTANFFAVVVVHELSHQPGFRRRLAGVVAGIAGYPWLPQEHLMHHSTSGNVELAEWPRVDESVWLFTVRRTIRVVHSSVEHNAMATARARRSGWRGGLVEAGAATICTGLAFVAVGGTSGLLLYLAASAGVHFGVQAVTYLQHWGLGVDSVENADEGRFAWEDRCRLQGWLMLHLALHQAHHQRSNLPYYRVSVDPKSPRLPAGYVLLLLASFVPPAWRWLMKPALEAWKADPAAHIEPARWRLVCLPSAYAPESRGYSS